MVGGAGRQFFKDTAEKPTPQDQQLATKLSPPRPPRGVRREDVKLGLSQNTGHSREASTDLTPRDSSFLRTEALTLGGRVWYP